MVFSYFSPFSSLPAPKANMNRTNLCFFLIGFPCFLFKNLAWLPSQKMDKITMYPITQEFVLIDGNKINCDCWRLEEDQLIKIYTHTHTHTYQVIIPNFLHKFHYGKATVCHCFQRRFVVLCVSAHFCGRQNTPLIVTLSGMYHFS